MSNIAAILRRRRRSGVIGSIATDAILTEALDEITDESNQTLRTEQ